MKILLANGTPHLPQVVGGLEVNTHELAIELNKRGEQTAVLSKLSPRDAFGALRLAQIMLRGAEVAIDRSLGYDVYRSREPWRLLKGLPKPRVVVIQNGNMVAIGRESARRGWPSLAYFHGLEFETGKRGWEDPPSELPFSAYIANSEFTAARFKAKFGREAIVIPPIFKADRYRLTDHAERRYVTFINPVPEKGVELALAIAGLCSEIPFRFIKGWPLPIRSLSDLRTRIAKLGNVQLCDRTNDLRTVYGPTRVLLVPSQWQAETWGRVASEAQFSGIPVLASDRGGLPESVGNGGSILPFDAPPEAWAEELRRLWREGDYAKSKSEAALAHSRRPQIDTGHQIDAFLSVIEKVAA